MVVKRKVTKKKVSTKKTKGYYKTPSGVKAKSRFTASENAVIKKYRQTGSMKSLTPKQRETLLRASFK